MTSTLLPHRRPALHPQATPASADASAQPEEVPYRIPDGGPGIETPRACPAVIRPTNPERDGGRHCNLWRCRRMALENPFNPHPPVPRCHSVRTHARVRLARVRVESPDGRGRKPSCSGETSGRPAPGGGAFGRSQCAKDCPVRFHQDHSRHLRRIRRLVRASSAADIEMAARRLRVATLWSEWESVASTVLRHFGTWPRCWKARQSSEQYGPGVPAVVISLLISRNVVDHRLLRPHVHSGDCRRLSVDETPSCPEIRNLRLRTPP
jgi:hypothetical protein